MSKNSKNLLQKYVPRHFRLGVCCSLTEVENLQEVREVIPVVDDSGSTIFTSSVIKQVSADDNMSKYKASAFRLSAMVESGVPLRVVNINHSNSMTIDQLEKICKDLDSADQYVQRVIAQQKEREMWLQPVSDDNVLSHDASN